MKEKAKHFSFLFLAIVCFSLLTFLFFTVDPSVSYFSISPLILFFLALTLGTFSFFYFLIRSVRRSILITCYVSGILLLRLLGFKSWIHIAFLFIILALIEIFFTTR